MGVKVSGFVLMLLVGCSYDKSASGVLCQEEYDVLVTDFFSYIFSLSPSGHLYVFASMQTHYSFFSGPQFQVTSKFTIYGALYVC